MTLKKHNKRLRKKYPNSVYIRLDFSQPHLDLNFFYVPYTDAIKKLRFIIQIFTPFQVRTRLLSTSN